MARIRTIKPAFFRHRRLYLAEQETGLPLRVAFAGLWTVADREGRFRWEPEEIKLDCLPYDDIDFSRVMHALFTRGFIVKYASGGREYGVIPSFKEHQIVNNREMTSDLPVPPDNLEELIEQTKEADASGTRDARDTIQTKGNRKGKEQEGKGTEVGTRETRPPVEEFEKFKKAYPKRGASNPWKPALRIFAAALKRGESAERIIAGAEAYRRECDGLKIVGTEKVAQAQTWLNQERWRDYLDSTEPQSAKVFLKAEDPRYSRWCSHLGKTKTPLVNGGWWFDSEEPPGADPPEKVEAA